MLETPTNVDLKKILGLSKINQINLPGGQKDSYYSALGRRRSRSRDPKDRGDSRAYREYRDSMNDRGSRRDEYQYKHSTSSPPSSSNQFIHSSKKTKFDDNISSLNEPGASTGFSQNPPSDFTHGFGAERSENVSK